MKTGIAFIIIVILFIFALINTSESDHIQHDSMTDASTMPNDQTYNTLFYDSDKQIDAPMIVMDQDGNIKITDKEEFKKVFIDSGKICEVIGHIWKPVIPYQFTLLACFDDDNNLIACSNPNIRECRLCEFQQIEQTETKWVDIEQ